MKISVLASGSKGNCTYIEDNETKILVDLGMTCNYIETNLKELEVSPKEIDGILITHTHSDHILGIKIFCRKYKTPIYISPNMEKEIKKIINEPNLIFIKKQMKIKNTEIKVIKNSHDAESYGFIINEKLVYITDTGYLNNKYFEMLKNKEMYIIESNHDIETLINGKYPFYLKQRILGDKGHLSNKDCSYYLSKLATNNTKYIILAHLSQENNSCEKTLETYLEHNSKLKAKMIIAKQKEKTELIEI